MGRTGTIVLYLTALALGLFQAYRPTIETRFALMQADPGDGLLNNYLLEHTYRAFFQRDYSGSLASPPFFFPSRNVLWYSETMLGAAPVYWVLRIWLPPDLAFQWWQIAMSALNYAAMAWVCRRLGCRHLLAMLGGYLWAFGVVHLSLGVHQQLIPRFWMPIAILCGWRFAQDPQLGSFSRMAGAAFLQCVTCVYTGWFLVFGLAVFVPAAIGLTGGRWSRTGCRLRTRKMWIVIAVWALAFGTYFAPYAVLNAGIARTYDDYAGSQPRVATWFSSPEGARWHNTIKSIASEDDFGRLFSGFGLYGIALAAVITIARTRDPGLAFVAAALTAAAAWILFTLDFGNGISAWSVIRYLPGGQAIRRLDRVGIVVHLFLTFAVVLWLQWASERLRGRWFCDAFSWLIVVVLVYEQTGLTPTAFRKVEYFSAADRYAESLRGADAGYVVPRPPNEHLYQLHGDLLGMWAGLNANIPVVNGYSARYPAGYPLYEGDAEAELRTWLTGRFRGRLAVVDPAKPDEVRWMIFE